jgi:ribosomal protein S21
MLKVEVNKNTTLEKALKTLKGKVIKTKQNEELRKRTEYVKKTTQKREKMKKAKYKQYLQMKSQSN